MGIIVDGQPDRARCVYTVCNYGAICKFNGPRRAPRRLDYIVVVYGYGVGGRRPSINKPTIGIH